ncbi:uncharacterized protein ppp1r3ab isoform X2 [Syngnathus typhle]|uniref:uncharacterized protein ppp1r3ab isoform X2 n=1 Tax=Syngnathus typhle TaxID=161592 RepID=UPI002A6A553C|nr:uncharacterized protein ppp1r3ab isoform X2 [Syngnathus typhle]
MNGKHTQQNLSEKWTPVNEGLAKLHWFKKVLEERTFATSPTCCLFLLCGEEDKQRPRRRDHLPFGSPQPSAPMDFEGRTRPAPACRLLLPGPEADEDDGDMVISIRPKSSPLPRRKSSLSDEDDSELEQPPPCGSRRVSFADALGQSLVQVKEFDLWDVPNPPGMEFLDGEGLATEEYRMSPLTFQSPLSPEDLLVRVQEQKVELESLELIPGTTTLKGLICVLNMSFHKAVYVRTTLDCWASHFDLLTEYIPTSGHAHMDRFSFKLTLVPPFEEQGSRVDFCLRYETPVGTFWANNDNRNYVLLCQKRSKEQRENPQMQNGQKKSCLKTVLRCDSQASADETLSQENSSPDGSTNGERVDNEQVILIRHQSEVDGNNSQDEIRQNCVRRKRRKAARMALVKDYFCERDGGVLDASTPKDDSEIPARESWSEDKVEGSCALLETTLRERPTRAHETQARHEPKTPDDAALTSSIQGDVSPDTSTDETPPAQHRDTFVPEAEGTNESCSNQSSGFAFGSHMFDDNGTCPDPIAGEDDTSRDVEDITRRVSLMLEKASEANDSVMGSRDHQHVTKNSIEGCFDANLNVPLVENGTWSDAEDSSKQRSFNVTKIHQEPFAPSRLPLHQSKNDVPLENWQLQEKLTDEFIDTDLNVPEDTWNRADDAIEGETEDIQRRCQPDEREEEVEIASPEAEEPDDVENDHVKMNFDVAEEHCVEIRGGKIEICLDEDGADVELEEQDIKPGDEEQQSPGDDIRGSQSGHSRDPTQQNPDSAHLLDEEIESEDAQSESDGASAESDSDDEVELYMHCLRAVRTKDPSAEAAFNLSKRPSLSKTKALSSPMPSISEAAEEDRVAWRPESQADNVVRSPPTESAGKNAVSRDSRSSCSSISTMLLYIGLLAVFTLTAYYYDFLACFGLYVVTLVWLLCQGEKHSMKDNSIG